MRFLTWMCLLFWKDLIYNSLIIKNGRIMFREKNGNINNKEGNKEV